MCYVVVYDGGISEYDWVVYGFFVGDFESVDKVCKLWDDKFFIYYNVFFRIQFDIFLMKKGGKDLVEIVVCFLVFNVVVYYGELVIVVKCFVVSLENDLKISNEVLGIFKLF